MQNAKTPKSMSGHALTQFQLTQNLLNNLSQFNITPTAKLVLLYLSSCYNPKKATMFPKQKTMSGKLGVSEVSVNRAIQELHKEGLIISERKYTLSYKYTSKFLNLCGVVKDLKEDNQQNDKEEINNLITPLIEPKKEQIKEPIGVDDFRILKQYAIDHKARNVNAYINALKQSGNAQKILAEYHQMSKRYETGEADRIAKIMDEEIEPMPQEFFTNFRAKLAAQCS